MTIKNNSKRLIILNAKEGDENVMIPLKSGEEVSDERLKQTDIEFFVDNGEIEVLSNDQDTSTLIVLTEPVSKESLKALTLIDLKLYCKQNNLKPYSKLNEDDLIEKILASLLSES